MSLRDELDILFANLQGEQCYNYIERPLNYTISGVNSGIIYIIFAYLIPNLFRICYAQQNISIPSVCPTYITTTNISNYLPKIINIELIKSFLYFNFPSSIKYNKNKNYNFIKNIIYKNNIINEKKRNTTCDSFTLATQLINSIYSEYSLLIQLKLFSDYIDSSVTNKVINSFIILWDFTQQCMNTQIIGNNNTNNIFNQLIAKQIYIINNNLISSNFPFLFKNNIFNVLDAVNTVYKDIINELNYYLNNKKFCKKKYMDIQHIPILIKIYNNYYNNQQL